MAATKTRRRAKTPARAVKKTKVATTRRKVPVRRAKASVPRKAARKRASQRFAISHHNEIDFQIGLRRYAQYRDLGINQATSGMVQAHVIRFVPPCRPEEVSKLHYHDVEFQMIYVLKGWIKTELEGQGAIGLV